MTVQELIDDLSGFPPEHKVECWGKRSYSGGNVVELEILEDDIVTITFNG